MPIAMYRLLDDPPPAESMGFVALKNVEAPMELMRIRVEWPDGIPTDGEKARETPPEAALVAATWAETAAADTSPSGATMGS